MWNTIKEVVCNIVGAGICILAICLMQQKLFEYFAPQPSEWAKLKTDSAYKFYKGDNSYKDDKALQPNGQGKESDKHYDRCEYNETPVGLFSSTWTHFILLTEKAYRYYRECLMKSQRLYFTFIRAESNATERMAPGELPSDIEVADETYLPPVNIKAEILAGKTEFIEETEGQIEELWPDGKSKNPRDLATIKTIEQLAKALKEDYGLTYQQQWAELNIGNWSELTTTPAEAYQKVAAART